MSRFPVVVVGGGVSGLACAWELTRGGAAMTVLERGEVRGSVSRGNTGWVVPSMAAPLPAPGMVREGVRQLVTRGNAFVFRPSLDPTFVRWLWRFWRSSSSARFDAGVRALLALNRRTLELFDAYRDAGIRFEMHSTGLLIVARTVAGLHHYKEVLRRLREVSYEGGEPGQLDRDALAELEPALDRHNVEAGLHARVDRYIRPEELTAGLADRLREEGALILDGCEVSDLRSGPDGWTLTTDAGETRAEKVVVAAGLPSLDLLGRLGARVAIQPARGYSVTIAGEGTPPRPGWRPDADGPLKTWARLRPVTADGLPDRRAAARWPLRRYRARDARRDARARDRRAARSTRARGRLAPELKPFAPGRR